MIFATVCGRLKWGVNQCGMCAEKVKIQNGGEMQLGAERFYSGAQLCARNENSNLQLGALNEIKHGRQLCATSGKS